MEGIILKTNLHCAHCENTMRPLLETDKTISEVKFNLAHPDKLVFIHGNGMDISSIISKFSVSGYEAKLINSAMTDIDQVEVPKNKFWLNTVNWKRASFNTLNCLIGCSIGDFGMLIYLQAYHPETSMLWQMILAIIAGLTTSIILESIILKTREKFNWALAIKTAFSMSFISMVGMEVAMNATDFMITGGKAAFDTLKYWLALIPAMIAGFIMPLPYNYYKLQKFNKACH